MRSYKIIVAYNGTKYSGWQMQPNKLSVAQILQDLFKKIFKTNISLLAASRTDAGVHAFGQVAVFETDLNIDSKKMLYAWGNLLPQDISLRSLELLSKRTNPQFDVLYKVYYYHFTLQKPLLFLAPFVLHYKNNKLNLEKLKSALNIFVGTHDFRSFCSGEYNRSTVRTINKIHLEYLRKYSCYRIAIYGPGFLHHMVRRIVGGSLEVASNENLSIEYLTKALSQKNPNQNLFTAPAHGLVLRKIIYKNI